MKKVSKNKFLTCFRPVLESEAVVDRSTSRRFACNPVLDKHDTKNSGTKSMFSDQECPKVTQNQLVRQPPKHSLTKVIEAVVFETKLNTRARNKKRYSQTCFGSKRSYSSCSESSSLDTTNTKEIKAPELSSSSSSSSSPVSESKSLSKSTKEQLEKQKKIQCQGIYMVLLSLVVTIFLGKINVSILTSILFFSLSLWNLICRQLKGVSKLRNTEFKVNKNGHRTGLKGRS